MAQPLPPAPVGAGPATAGGQATSFGRLYQDAAQDPYHGDYAAVMRTFRDTAGAATANELFELARNVNLNTLNVYIGLYNKDGEECGRTLTMHGFATYAPML
ncbi:hypothetical protein ACA910_011644 [Epithemia clementina (nom. ined.)]